MKKIFNKSIAILGIASVLFSLIITVLNDLLTGKVEFIWKYVIIVSVCLLVFLLSVLVFYIFSMNSKPINIGDALKLQTILNSVLENEELLKKYDNEGDIQKRKIYLYKILHNYENEFLYTQTHPLEVVEHFAQIHKNFLKQNYSEMDETCKIKFNRL